MGWGMFPWIADRLAEAGFAAIRFDFAFNGADEHGDFTRLEDFRRNTFTCEQNDLDSLLAAVSSGDFGDACLRERIGLLGHSRGGGGVILKEPGDARVAAVAALAPIAHTMRFPPEVVAIAERDGFYSMLNTRTKQEMPVGLEVFQDAEKHDILAAAEAMTQPLFTVHGTEDLSVPVAEGRQIAAVHGEYLEIDGSDHTFGAVHPFECPTPHLVQAVDAVVEYFARTLA
jgi:dienelactone hydrolase